LCVIIILSREAKYGSDQVLLRNSQERGSMKKIFLFITLSLLFANFAHARIGETLPELEKRFGKGKALSKLFVKSPFSKIVDLKKNGIRIRAYFIDSDKCDMISYSAKPGQSLKPDERAKFLNLNKQESVWIKTPKPTRFYDKSNLFKPKESWKRKDGKMFAYNFSNRTISILTPNYLEKQKELDDKIAAEKAKKEKHKLDGF
jgi:hypothetical protein